MHLFSFIHARAMCKYFTSTTFVTHAHVSLLLCFIRKEVLAHLDNMHLFPSLYLFITYRGSAEEKRSIVLIIVIFSEKKEMRFANSSPQVPI